MIKYQTKNYENVRVAIATFRSKSKLNDEFQILFTITNHTLSFDEQCRVLVATVSSLMSEAAFRKAIPVFGRCFMSDPSNQQQCVQRYLSQSLRCAVSLVGQPPLDGSKIALWLQLQTEGKLGVEDGLYYCEHNGLRHYRNSEYSSLIENSFAQTYHLFEDLEVKLHKHACSIEKSCLRTWLFVRDIDVNYHGVVEARKEFFQKHGLTSETHYIASTGIEGKCMKSSTKVILDTYCIEGLLQEQIKYLYAKDYLNSTYEYGVTFERGVCMDYGDRRQIYISGTASIDNKGMILHIGDVVGQSQRACENVAALLQEADCSFKDVSLILIYVRDVNDYPRVKEVFEKRFPKIPKQIVLAPICRPGWLIEMECIAEKSVSNDKYVNY